MTPCPLCHRLPEIVRPEWGEMACRCGKLTFGGGMTGWNHGTWRFMPTGSHRDRLQMEVGQGYLEWRNEAFHWKGTREQAVEQAVVDGVVRGVLES